MPAAPSRCRACSARPKSQPGRNCSTSSTHGSPHRALRKDEAINHVHWATTRRPQPGMLMALAIDHRKQLDDMANRLGAPRERINGFKRLAMQAIAKVADGRPGFGTLARRHLWPRGHVRCGKARSLGGPPPGGARLAAIALRIHARMSARASSNGRSPTPSNACPSITPTTPPALQRRTVAEDPHAL